MYEKKAKHRWTRVRSFVIGAVLQGATVKTRSCNGADRKENDEITAYIERKWFNQKNAKHQTYSFKSNCRLPLNTHTSKCYIYCAFCQTALRLPISNAYSWMNHVFLFSYFAISLRKLEQKQPHEMRTYCNIEQKTSNCNQLLCFDLLLSLVNVRTECQTSSSAISIATLNIHSVQHTRTANSEQLFATKNWSYHFHSFTHTTIVRWFHFRWIELFFFFSVRYKFVLTLIKALKAWVKESVKSE